MNDDCAHCIERMLTINAMRTVIQACARALSAVRRSSGFFFSMPVTRSYATSENRQRLCTQSHYFVVILRCQLIIINNTMVTINILMIISMASYARRTFALKLIGLQMGAANEHWHSNTRTYTPSCVSSENGSQPLSLFENARATTHLGRRANRM